MKQVPKGWECVRGDRGTPGQGRLKRSKNWNHDPPSHLVWDASAFQTSPPPVKITTMIIITMVTTWCIRSSKVPIASSFSLRPASWCWMVEPWLMITWWWEVKINWQIMLTLMMISQLMLECWALDDDDGDYDDGDIMILFTLISRWIESRHFSLSSWRDLTIS